jgi:hypothetical protein
MTCSICLAGLNYVSRLAYPPNYRVQEYISTLARNLTRVNQLWVGLDARSQL